MGSGHAELIAEAWGAVVAWLVQNHVVVVVTNASWPKDGVLASVVWIGHEPIKQNVLTYVKIKTFLEFLSENTIHKCNTGKQ
jgi:hypothetical protein